MSTQIKSTQVMMLTVGVAEVFHRPTESGAITIAVNPGSGGTVIVETMTAAGGTWIPVSDGNLTGNLSESVSDVLTSALYAVRFLASGAPATIELAW